MATDALSINQSSQGQTQRNAMLGKTGRGYVLPESGKTLPKNIVGVSEEVKAAENLKQEDLQKITDSLNKYLQSRDLKLQFSLDNDSGRTVIKVINKETNEIIRQFPSDEILYLAKTINNNLDAALDGNTGFLLETEV